MHVLQRRILISLILVLVIVILGLLAGEYTSLQWLIERENRLRNTVERRPVAAWGIGFVAYVCLSLIPGTSGKSVIFGWLFGFWSAVLMVDCALTVAALCTFAFSRYALRSFVEARYAEVLQRWKERLRHDTAYYLLLLRLMHAPFSVVNYGAGALNLVPTSTFWWTTQLGLLPGTMVFVFAGSRLPTLAELAERGVWELLDAPLIGALIFTAVMPIVVRAISRTLHQPESTA
ncbi:MAG: VTT domain-containing protein [Planctomycetaceae bacterium]